MKKASETRLAPGKRPADTRHAGERTAWPIYCDFSCRHASFGDPAAVGACRRDIGVWCEEAKRFNNKHARCLMAQPR